MIPRWVEEASEVILGPNLNYLITISKCLLNGHEEKAEPILSLFARLLESLSVSSFSCSLFELDGKDNEVEFDGCKGVDSELERGDG
jgi:hypothetical protein